MTAMTTTKITTEELQRRVDSYGAVLAHGNYVLATFATWTKDEGFGNNAQVYRLIEEPINGFGPDTRGFNECGLELVTEADHLFADAGHAIAWTLTHI
ncbi:Uncharacterised protein [Trueperella bialowiezensis]|uniref:Nucleotide modification associated domain-containing protein n=2 Tax=Trueperella bialowiezensis TaxID=312285 RepID=A0A3S4WH74_9ACTO|nr:Uncharacterised protein [Trueperella bialowiezensis]